VANRHMKHRKNCDISKTFAPISAEFKCADA